MSTSSQLHAELATARQTWGERGEADLESGLFYTSTEPVRILVQKRGHRYDLTDRGTGVRLSGNPRGWLDVAEDVVARAGLNVNRRGVVFVPVAEGRDLGALAMRVAETSREVYLELLEREIDETTS